MKEIEEIKRKIKTMDPQRAIEIEKKLMHEVISPLLGTVDVSEELGWPKSMAAVYNARGKLPLPIGHVGNRPYWTKRQIEIYKLQNRLGK